MDTTGKTQLVYKVVRKPLLRVGVSPVADIPGLRLSYTIGKRCTPFVGRILAFDSLVLALRFATGGVFCYRKDDLRILACEAYNPAEVRHLLKLTLGSNIVGQVQAFWESFENGNLNDLVERNPGDYTPAPSGALACESLTPTSEVADV